jgi:hypothetical protein
MMLALIPCCTILPFDRLLIFVGLGAMGLLAQMIYVMGKFFNSEISLFKRIIISGICLLFISLHLILAPVLLPLRISGFTAWGKNINRSIESASLDSAICDKTLIVVNASGFYTTYLPIIRAMKGQLNPIRIRSLNQIHKIGQQGVGPMHISRPDRYTLVVKPEGGFPWLFVRDDSHPLPVGTRIQLSDMTIEVTKLAEGGWPLEVMYRFTLPLEDPSFVWAKIKHNEFVPFELPEVGESLFMDIFGHSVISGIDPI